MKSSRTGGQGEFLKYLLEQMRRILMKKVGFRIDKQEEVACVGQESQVCLSFYLSLCIRRMGNKQKERPWKEGLSLVMKRRK